MAKESKTPGLVGSKHLNSQTLNYFTFFKNLFLLLSYQVLDHGKMESWIKESNALQVTAQEQCLTVTYLYSKVRPNDYFTLMIHFDFSCFCLQVFCFRWL